MALECSDKDSVEPRRRTNEMTTIKTWDARYKDEPLNLLDALKGEITDLRAAVERKDALLRKCLTVIWLDADGLKVRVQIKKELS
jgi:hypothetical protein